jgi:hypothetical protein
MLCVNPFSILLNTYIKTIVFTNSTSHNIIQCYVGLTIFLKIFSTIPMLILNVRTSMNIPWTIVSPTEHCYEYE